MKDQLKQKLDETVASITAYCDNRDKALQIAIDTMKICACTHEEELKEIEKLLK